MSNFGKYILIAGMVLMSRSAFCHDRIRSYGTGTTSYMSRKQAEKTLDEFARTAHIEDVWVHDGKRLVDIGEYKQDRNLMISYQLLDSIISETHRGDTIILYHNHPKACYGTHFKPVSSMDIALQSGVTIKYRRKGIVIIGKMFDGRGMWEFSASSRLSDLMNIDVYKANEFYEDLLRFMMHSNRKDMWNHNNKGKPEKNRSHTPNQYDPISVEEYISTLKQEDINLKYTPSEDMK